MAADEGGGKPRGDAAPAASAEAERDADGADDLAALAGGLGSLAPGDDEGSDEDAHDLAALSALTASSAQSAPGLEDAPLRLSREDGGPAAVAAVATAPDQPVRTPSRSASVAPARPAAPPAPVSAPVAAARAPWITPLLVGIGVGIGIAGVMYGLSQRRPADSQPAAASAPAIGNGAAPALRGGTASEPVAAAAAPEPVVAALAPTAVPAAQPAAEPAHSPVRAAAGNAAQAVGPSRVHEGDALPAPPRGSAADAPPVLAVKPAADAPAEGEEPDVSAAVADTAAKPGTTMDALLDEALSPKARRDELAARQQAALEASAPPPTPTREQVTQAMTVLLPAIRGCAMGQSGLATAVLVVHSDGRVASVEVAGAPFAGSASGRCMEGVIRRARFPQFSQPSFRIKFPLAIQ